MHHEATGIWARGSQMSGLSWFNRVRVMDASFLHADLLFAAIIQGPGPKVRPSQGPDSPKKSDVFAFLLYRAREKDLMLIWTTNVG